MYIIETRNQKLDIVLIRADALILEVLNRVIEPEFDLELNYVGNIDCGLKIVFISVLKSSLHIPRRFGSQIENESTFVIEYDYNIIVFIVFINEKNI